MTSEQELLSTYKKYDYLNKDEKHPLIKILVSYIKPAFLFKSEILTPIHLGRAVEKEDSKDGKLSDKALKWLHDNCEFSDDFEGGISQHNRRIGFLTGTYWAWKNYEQLGNPKYISVCGYRKLFTPDFLKSLNEYDAIIPEIEQNSGYMTNKERYIGGRGQDMYNITIEVLEKFHPQEISDFNNYFNFKEGYYHELYILKQNLFFEFCDWMFPMLFDLLKYSREDYYPKKELSMQNNFCYQIFSTKDIRDIAFVIERLTGYYCYKLKQRSDINVKEEKFISFVQNSDMVNTKTISEVLRNRLMQKNMI